MEREKKKIRKKEKKKKKRKTLKSAINQERLSTKIVHETKRFIGKSFH